MIGYTRHGHHIAGTDGVGKQFRDWPKDKLYCGGTTRCPECINDVLVEFERRQKEETGTCVACSADLAEVYLGSSERRVFSNALQISFAAGYGEFKEVFSDDEVVKHVVFCQSCALKLTDQFPVLKTLFGMKED